MKRLILIAAMMLSGILAWSQDLGDFHRGRDSVIFIYEPLKEKPITLYYYIPLTGNVKKMPVLFSFHGAERQGKNPITCWREFAERDGFIVLSPEFKRSLYDENQYQFGNVFKTRKCEELNPEEKWVYSAIEPMFEYFKAQTGNKSRTFSIQGHSAGGQFVHRFLLAKPKAPVDIAVASNPGTWTWISDDSSVNGYTEPTTWPYTIKGTPFDDEEHIKAYFGRYMVVHLGDADTLTEGNGVPTDAVALAEGKHRFDRGQKYFAGMKEYAKEKNMPFRWDIKIAHGIGHAGRGVVYAKSYRDENGKRRYSADIYSPNGAYAIIFGSSAK